MVGNWLENAVPESQQARTFLAASGDLAVMPERLRTAVLDRCSLRRFSAGENLYALGDPPGGPYGLVAGGVALFTGQAEHGPYFAHFGRPGCVVSEVYNRQRFRGGYGIRAIPPSAEPSVPVRPPSRPFSSAGIHAPCAASRSSTRAQIWSRSSSAAVCGSSMAAW